MMESSIWNLRISAMAKYNESLETLPLLLTQYTGRFCVFSKRLKLHSLTSSARSTIYALTPFLRLCALGNTCSLAGRKTTSRSLMKLLIDSRPHLPYSLCTCCPNKVNCNIQHGADVYGVEPYRISVKTAACLLSLLKVSVGEFPSQSSYCTIG